MGGLCPDLYANVHSGCGYPSGAQPDTYVNEEWFGLFAIQQPQCQAGGTAYDLDSIRAREAWFRLKLLWAQGSCLSFYGMNDTDARRPYNASAWPECGPELSRMRTELSTCKQLIADWAGRKAVCRDLSARVASGECDWNCEQYVADCDRVEATATELPCAAWADYSWDGADCSLQALIIDGRCPEVPAHMREVNRSVYLERSAWQVRASV